MSLKKLRQKYPQYNDISDLELAEGFYKKHYSDLDETEYYEKMFNSLWKDFEIIKNAIIEGEEEIETRNKTEEEDRSGPKTCEICID